MWKKKGGVGAPPVISHTNSVDSFGNSAGWSGVDSCRCVQRRQHGGGDDAVARRPGGGGEGSCAPPTGSADSYACRRGAAIRCFSAPQKPDPVLCFRACAAVPVDAPPPPPPRARSAQRAVRIRTAVWVSWLPDLLSRVRVVFADGAQIRAREAREQVGSSCGSSRGHRYHFDGRQDADGGAAEQHRLELYRGPGDGFFGGVSGDVRFGLTGAHQHRLLDHLVHLVVLCA